MTDTTDTPITDTTPKCVLADTMRFKARAEIGDKAYAWLVNTENLQQFVSALATGIAVGGGTLIALWLSMGFWGKLAFAIGLTTLNWPLALALGVMAASGTFVTLKVVRKGRKLVIEEIPKFVSCPLDLLAAQAAQILLTPFAMLADSDKKAQALLVKQWGFDRKYVAWLADQIQHEPEKYSLTILAKQLRQVRLVAGHIETNRLVREIELVADEVCPIRNKQQQQVFEAFSRYLAKDKEVTLETIRYLEELVLGRTVTLPPPPPRMRPFWKPSL